MKIKIGDMVRLKGDYSTVGIVISTLQGNGYLDFRTLSGRVVFSYWRSLEVISESR